MSDTNLDLAMRVLERRIEVLESAVGPGYVKSVPQIEPKQPKYEYCILYHKGTAEALIPLIDELNNAQRYGWRLICDYGGMSFILEREIISETS